MKDYIVAFEEPYKIDYEVMVQVKEILTAEIDESDPKNWLVSLEKDGAALDHGKMDEALQEAGAKHIPGFIVKPSPE